MPEMKTKNNFYRTRTAYSVTQIILPIVSKHPIDIQSAAQETPTRARRAFSLRRTCRLTDTTLDRIIRKVKGNRENRDILLLITPASRHVNLYKLHVMQRHNQDHLGMITITLAELSRLKASKAIQQYCIVFGSHYMNLLQTESMQGLFNCLNKKCCGASNEAALTKAGKSNASLAGDYFKEEIVQTVEYQDSFIQTDPEIVDNSDFSLEDIHVLMETINHNMPASHTDMQRFFFMADKLNFSLVLRPELLWKSSTMVDKRRGYFIMESYLPGNCHLGSIALLENDVLQALDLYPKLLFNIHVIEDVFEITPVSGNLVNVLKRVAAVLKLELLYDAVGELIFDCCKHFTFL